MVETSDARAVNAETSGRIPDRLNRTPAERPSDASTMISVSTLSGMALWKSTRTSPTNPSDHP